MAVTDADGASQEERLPGWSYQPPVPIQVSPLFRWPLDPLACVRWLLRSWFPVSERLVIAGLALLSWTYLSPSLARCRELELGWIAEIYARNLGLLVLVAGGLHLALFTFKRQGDKGRYDARPLARESRAFTLNNQVADNVVWSCASGVTVWTAYEVLMLWAMANGFVPVLAWADSPLWFVLLFVLVPIWETFYFYWVHRLLHWPPLYRLAHAVHHRNVAVGPWSGLSMHPIEHLLYLGSVLIHWVVPAHPLHIVYHLQYFTLSAVTTHSGFEGLVVGGKSRLALGTFHHQMHHRYFDCNYGGLEMPWDKWLGSFHDGTPEAHRRIQERRRRLAARA